MASIWLASRRCSASGSHPSASSPSRCRQVRSDGRDVSPASAPASALVRCLACSSVSAPRVNDIWVHTRTPRSSTGAPAPAAEAPVPALSSSRAPIRSVKACASIAPAYRHVMVPVSILLATCQPGPSRRARPRPPLGPAPASAPASASASAAPRASAPASVSPPPGSPAVPVRAAPPVSSNRVSGAGSVPCFLSSSVIRDRDTPSLRPISAWVRPCPAQARAWRSRAGLRIGGRPIWCTSPLAPCWR